MIISASRRTDIPALYGDWFINRIKEGFVYVRNPFNTHAISKILLTSNVVDIIIFWTKDPQPFMAQLSVLDSAGYKYYFQYTLNPYDKTIEPGLRDKDQIINTFINLSSKIGKDKVIWRYDPILMGGNIGIEYHLSEFKKYADVLYKHTDTVIISFLDDYKKIDNKRPVFRKLDEEEMMLIGDGFVQIAKERGLCIKTCAEQVVYKNGIQKASCIDPILISKILGEEIKVGKDKNQRKECLCVESIDIGEYDSCSHLCKYCYANCNDLKIIKNVKLHKSCSPILIGEVSDGDIIKVRPVKSIKTGQTKFLFD